jgi:hypothetical protein
VACVVTWCVTATAQTPTAPQNATPLLHRVFLKDGTPLISYGQYTRTQDRVYFTVPLGSVSKPDGFQIVSLPDGVVDWEKTQAYTDTVNFKHYVATRGDADYTALTAEVARALSEIALSKDGAKRLTLARQVRAMLVEWPRTHYGYRSRDVIGLTELLDEAISAAKAEIGDYSYSFDLVAVVDSPPGELLPVPTPAETVASAWSAAKASDSPVERLALQQSILATLSGRRNTLPKRWATLIESEVKASVKRDIRDTRAYGDLSANAVRSAAKFAAAGNASGVERILGDVRARDARLGQRRNDDMTSLLAALEYHLDAARTRRLELDRWAYRVQAFRDYRDIVTRAIERMDSYADALEAIRLQSGPKPSALDRMVTRLDQVLRSFSPLVPPQGLEDGHGALASAATLMIEAARQRRQAVATASREQASNASAAAAGAAMLLNRSHAAIDAFFARPGSR